MNSTTARHPESPTPPPPRRGALHHFASPWLLALVIFAGSFALFTRHNHFPFSYHPDEGGKVGQIIEGSRNYHHPLLLLSATDVVSRVALVARTPQRIVETGRAVSAAFAAGTVAALALLAWRCCGVFAGWCAGLAVALQADLFETAHYMKEDPTLVFGLALSLLAAQVWWQRPGRTTLRFLALACALAAAGKYLGVVALIFALPLTLARGESGADANWQGRLRTFAAVFSITFLLCNLPIIAGKISSPFRSISNEMQGVSGGHLGITRKVPHGEYLGMLRREMPAPVGCLAGAYAIVLFATARRRTPPEWVTLLFPLAYLAMISCSPKIAGRYLLPVSTLLPFLAALGAAELARLLFPPGVRWRALASSLVLAGLTGWIIRSELPLLRSCFEGFQHDDPAEVAQWVKTHLPADAIIAEDHRVNLSPDKTDGLSKTALVPQKVLDAGFAPDLGTFDELLAKGVTHIAVCHQSYGRYFSDQTQPKGRGKASYDRRREFYRRVFAEGELIQEWPRGRIAYLQPGIRLYRLKPPSTPAGQAGI